MTKYTNVQPSICEVKLKCVEALLQGIPTAVGGAIFSERFLVEQKSEDTLQIKDIKNLSATWQITRSETGYVTCRLSNQAYANYANIFGVDGFERFNSLNAVKEARKFLTSQAKRRA